MQAVATLEMDGTNIVGLLNELEARQLIERRRSPEDRRRHLVELTGAGAEQLAKAESALSAAEDEVLGARSTKPSPRRSTACFSRRPSTPR